MTPQLYHLECFPLLNKWRYSEDRHINLGGTRTWKPLFTSCELKILLEKGFYYVPSLAFNIKNQFLRKLEDKLDNGFTRYLDRAMWSQVAHWPIIRSMGQESLFHLCSK